jgi:hypothetical protein
MAGSGRAGDLRRGEKMRRGVVVAQQRGEKVWSRRVLTGRRQRNRQRKLASALADEGESHVATHGKRER